MPRPRSNSLSDLDVRRPVALKRRASAPNLFNRGPLGDAKAPPRRPSESSSSDERYASSAAAPVGLSDLERLRQDWRWRGLTALTGDEGGDRSLGWDKRNEELKNYAEQQAASKASIPSKIAKKVGNKATGLQWLNDLAHGNLATAKALKGRVQDLPALGRGVFRAATDEEMRNRAATAAREGVQNAGAALGRAAISAPGTAFDLVRNSPEVINNAADAMRLNPEQVNQTLGVLGQMGKNTATGIGEDLAVGAGLGKGLGILGQQVAKGPNWKFKAAGNALIGLSRLSKLGAVGSAGSKADKAVAKGLEVAPESLTNEFIKLGKNPSSAESSGLPSPQVSQPPSPTDISSRGPFFNVGATIQSPVALNEFAENPVVSESVPGKTKRSLWSMLGRWVSGSTDSPRPPTHESPNVPYLQKALAGQIFSPAEGASTASSSASSAVPTRSATPVPETETKSSLQSVTPERSHSPNIFQSLASTSPPTSNSPIVPSSPIAQRPDTPGLPYYEGGHVHPALLAYWRYINGY